MHARAAAFDFHIKFASDHRTLDACFGERLCGFILPW
jgi:hypothetical protein